MHDANEAQTRNPSVSSQALYQLNQCALLNEYSRQQLKHELSISFLQIGQASR